MNISNKCKALLAGVSLAVMVAGAASAAEVVNGGPVSVQLADGSLVQAGIIRDDHAFKNTAVTFFTAHCTPGYKPDKDDPSKQVWGWAKCDMGPVNYMLTEGAAQGLTKEVVHGFLFWGALANQNVEKINGGTQTFNVSAGVGNTSATGGASSSTSGATGGSATGGNATGGNASSNAQGGSSSATGGNSVAGAQGGNSVAGANAGSTASSEGNNTSATAVSGSSSTSNANSDSSAGGDHHD